MDNNTDFATMTPDDLRKEADRRELVEKARVLAYRHDARVKVIKILRDIDQQLLIDANCWQKVSDLIHSICRDDSEEPSITNGDVSKVGRGMPMDWWREACKTFPQREFPDLIEDILRGRKRPFERSVR